MTKSRQWYQVKAKSGSAAELLIYDEIGAGWDGTGVSAESFIESIKSIGLKAGDELTVRINSPGGSYFDGVTIYNYLRSLASRVLVRVDGVAASAASIVAMAGDRVEMPENAFLFIHNPWTFAMGDANALRKQADDLDKLRESALATYGRRTDGNLSRKELGDMLDAETWLSAEQSVRHGFADSMYEPVRAAALAGFDFSRYGIRTPPAIAQARKTEIERMRSTLRVLKGE